MSPIISAVPYPRLSVGSPIIRGKCSDVVQLRSRGHGLRRPSCCSMRPGNLPVNRRLGLETTLNPRRDLGIFSGRNIWFRLNAKSDGERGVDMDEAEKVARGESTMPEQFRYLTKEASDPPVRWPFFVVTTFLIYAWRAVLFELSNWTKALWAIVGFVGYLLKLVLALIVHFTGNPVTSTIRFIETALYTIRAFYSSIISYAPVPELTAVVIYSSVVIAIAEAVVPDAVKSQPYTLTFSGLVGYAAVKGYISEPFFWTILVVIYGFSRLVKRKNDVSSALPAAAVMAAIGEPWVRVLVITAFLALAIHHHWRKISEGKACEDVIMVRKPPLPLLGVALAIGVRLAAKWAGYRHLTWMIV
ncbi:hypothetical protein SAY86_028255 [Trapa natans]|uniref:Uncharacterized protein n=1 Tax=Trapa natans TaxID=22666 RepID=A0AAN7M1Y4_TRANT|nr:hypothetical protein SAY86_028255 [Trapa natans]